MVNMTHENLRIDIQTTEPNVLKNIEKLEITFREETDESDKSMHSWRKSYTGPLKFIAGESIDEGDCVFVSDVDGKLHKVRS